MAVTVANSNNRLTNADTTTGWASDGGGGAGPQLEPDLGYQLTSGSNYSVSRKVGTAKGGHAYTHGSTTDMTAAADQVVMFKAVWYNSINVAVYPACTLKVGNDASNYNEYGVISSDMPDQAADPKRLVYLVPIDPNVAAWADIVAGTVTLTAIDFFGIQGDFGGSAKAENVACDAIDLVSGDGVLWMTGGTPDGAFADFVSHDEGTIANRFGHISTLRDNVLDVYGKLWIGRDATPTATATQFTDSAKTVLFGKGFFAAGWTGIGVDLGNASTDVNFSDIVFSGLGQGEKVVYFDTITQINTTTDYITLSPDPAWDIGTPIVYSNDGGSDTIGLTSGNTYWVEPTGTAGQYYVHSSRNNARTSATPIALSVGTTGESHKVTSTPDIRPDLEVVGTSGAFDSAGCTYNRFREIVLTTAATFTGDIFRSCKLIDMTTNNGGSLQGCTMTGQTTEPGVALVKTNTTANIDNCDFSLGLGTGSAIDVDTAGSYTLDGNILTGYWTSPDNENGATFDTITGVDAATETITSNGHGFSNGDEIYYNDNGGTDTIGITDGNRYYAGNVTANTFTVHRSKENGAAGTNAINLSDGSTGETHTFYSGKAAIVNSSGGAVTLTVGGGGTTPSIRNVGASTTTLILNPVTTLIRVRDNTGAVLQNARVLIEAGDGTGDLPFEETISITRVGTTATATHTAHGLSNGDKVAIRNASDSLYNGVFAITNVTANTYDYTMDGTPAASPATVAAGKAAITSTGVVIEGLTNVSGEISASKSFSVNQVVRGSIRKSTSAPYFKSSAINDTINSSTGLTIDRRLQLDQ